MGARVEGGLEQERLAICLPPLLAQESTGQAPDHCLPGHLVSSGGGGPGTGLLSHAVPGAPGLSSPAHPRRQPAAPHLTLSLDTYSPDF